jgi:hypothetical protein
MTMVQKAARWGGARMSRRLSKSLPWVGALIGLATIAAAIRRKGWLGGSVDTALNAMPFVGGAKNAYEWARGRDLIRDRVRPVAGTPR